MKIQHLAYSVSASIEIEKSEIEDIMRVAKEHYDYACKALASERGILPVWIWFCHERDRATVDVKIGDADLITKTLEMEHHYGVDLYSKWYGLLRAMIDDQERVNAPWMVQDTETFTQTYRDKLRGKYNLPEGEQ